MKTIWSIVRKDLRRLWPVAACWLGMEIVLGALVLWAQEADPLNAKLVARMIVLDGMPWEVAVTVLVSAFYVVALMRGDRVAGNDMFWVTRPISPGMLLAAKLIAAGILVLALPCFVHAVWWAYHGLSCAQMWECGWPVMLRQTITGVMAFILCVLFTSGSRGGNPLLGFLLLLIGLMTIFPVMLNVRGLGIMPMPATPRTYFGVSNISWELWGTRVVLAYGLMLLTFVVVVWNQFWRRRSDISMAIGGGGLVLVLVVMFAWPIPAPWISSFRPGQLPTPAMLGFGFRVEGVSNIGGSGTRFVLREMCAVDLLVEGKAADERVIIDYASGEIEFSDDSILAVGGGADTEQTEKSVSNSTIRSEGFMKLLLSPKNEGDQWARWKRHVAENRLATAKVQLYARGRVHRNEGVHEVPLVAGSRSVLAGSTMRFVGYRNVGDEAVLVFVETGIRGNLPRGGYRIGLTGSGTIPEKSYLVQMNKDFKNEVHFVHLGISADRFVFRKNAGKERELGWTDETLKYSLYKRVYSLPRYWEGKVN